MNIVCATDDNFVQHCCIMLVSLLCNNNDVEIYVLTEGLKPENESVIREEVEAKGGRVHFCNVDSSIIDEMPLSKAENLSHISKATYYRLVMADILPQDVEKAIYLDCDIVVHDSIQDFWDVNMDGYAIAAVRQIASGKEAERLGYPIEYGYFNAGVTMMNIQYCRENHITKQLIWYIAEHHAELKYNDQDVLNAVLYDKCIHLLPQWNMNGNCCDRWIYKKGDKRNGVVVNDYQREKENIKYCKKHPVIVHYVSKPKPWNKGCVHPLYDLYYDYAKKTINFSHIKPQNKMVRDMYLLKNFFAFLLYAIRQTIHTTDSSLI